MKREDYKAYLEREIRTQSNNIKYKYLKNDFNTFSVLKTYGNQKQAIEWAKQLENAGIGELLITSVEREGSWEGYDVELIKSITKNVQVPVIANGGCGKIEHIGEVLKKANASACAVGSMVVYQKKEMGVLVNFPDRKKLEEVLK